MTWGMDVQSAIYLAEVHKAAAYIVLLELEDRQMLQDVMLDACSVLRADPVLGGGPDKALRAVFILDPACVAPQVTVNVT